MRITGRTGLLLLLLVGSPLLVMAQAAERAPRSRLVWCDEFNQPDGSGPDPAKWRYEIGGNGWGNDELEYYTSRKTNVRVENGNLVIEARKEHFGNRQFTSGRLASTFSLTYGRVEARIKVPRGQGIWPAFWMLGTKIRSVGWPECGEIDIMENIGREAGTIHGTVHGPGYSGDHGIGGPVTLPGGAAFADDFHIFAVECQPQSIKWYLDGHEYFEVTRSSLPKNKHWVFDQPKFMILNLAVGGRWPGNPDQTSVFPQRMSVDYVRVYEN